MIDELLAAIAGSPWALPALFVLVLGDAFLVVVPGEAAVTGLAALSVTQGEPAIGAVIGVAAFAAFLGDLACYLAGRRIGLERWGWMRRPRVTAAFAWAHARLERGTASIIFTARFVPFARIAVNLTAGAGRLPAGRYLAAAGGAAMAWACYQALIGAAVARLLPDAPAVAVIVSIVIAVSLGLALDALLTRRART